MRAAVPLILAVLAAASSVMARDPHLQEDHLQELDEGRDFGEPHSDDFNFRGNGGRLREDSNDGFFPQEFQRPRPNRPSRFNRPRPNRRPNRFKDQRFNGQRFNDQRFNDQRLNEQRFNGQGDVGPPPTRGVNRETGPGTGQVVGGGFRGNGAVNEPGVMGFMKSLRRLVRTFI